MPNPSERSIATVVCELILAAIRVKDDDLNELASELCAKMNGPVCRTLITEAGNRKNRPAHRTRLLRTIGRLGPIADPDDWFRLLTTMQLEKNPLVREEANRLFANMPDQQAGQEPSADDCGHGVGDLLSPVARGPVEIKKRGRRSQ